MPAINYSGVRYPVSTETIRAVIDKIESFDFVQHRALFEFETTDGRWIVLNIGPSLPIALEGDPK